MNMNRMVSVRLLAGVLIALVGLATIVWMCRKPVKESFGNPTNPMDPSSPSGPAGAAGGPGVMSPTGDPSVSDTSSPINAPVDSPVPFSSWNPPSTPGGPVPEAKQTSAMSSTLPQATVANPANSIAQNSDIVSTLDAIDAYNQIVANTNTALMTDAGRQQVMETTSAIADMRPDLIAAQANPAAATPTVAQLSALRLRISNTGNVLRQFPSTATKTPTASGQMTLGLLTNLVTRIRAASVSIANLNSTDATLVQRKSKLDQMAADLNDMIARIKSGSLALADVPIKPADATAFLAAVDSTKMPLPTLMTPAAANTVATNTVNTVNTVAASQALLQSVQKAMANVKFQITYDPASSQRTEVMDRLNALEDKLFAYASSDTPIPASTMGFLQQELSILGAMVGAPLPAHSPTDSVSSVSTRMDSSADPGAEYPSLAQLAAASGATDDQIAKRGSSASFDESTVGGLDYKARAVEMCRQLKSAYGDNTTFGCVKDPDSVSPEYSWRGNYMSVCNRIGDVWGGRTGEQYGCPPFNPAAKFSST